MKKFAKLLIPFVLVFVLSACSCSFDIGGGDESDTPAGSGDSGTTDVGTNSTINVEDDTAEASEFKTYTGSDMAITFDYPGAWQQTFEDQIIFLYAPSNENVNIQNLNKSMYATIDDVITDLSNQLTTAENSNIVGVTDITINGRPGKELNVTYSLDGVDYMQQSAVVEHDYGFYMVTLTTWGSYDAMKDGFAKVKDSLSF